MSTGTPVNEYQAHAWLTVEAADHAAASTAAQAAISAINAAVKALSNGSELSFAEDGGQIEFDEPSGNNGSFTTEGALIVGASTEATAQQAAEAAVAAADGAAPAGATLTVEQENGRFVFDLMQ